MEEFHTVARVGDIPAGEGRAYTVLGRSIAIFLVDGQYTAIDDICPHMGASLATGYVDQGGVICPWHAWRFCVSEGTWLDNPQSQLRQKRYPVRVVGEEIQVCPTPIAGSPSV